MMCALTLVVGLFFANSESIQNSRAEVFVPATKCEHKGADSSPTVSDTGQSSDAGCQTGGNARCNRVRTETAVSQNCIKHQDHCCVAYDFTPYTCTWMCVKIFENQREQCLCAYEKVEGNTVTQRQTVECYLEDTELEGCKDAIEQTNSCTGREIPAGAEDCEKN